ncbi:MAG: sigma 54-interacting transcriptional regulator [Proteocatella sp.]
MDDIIINEDNISSMCFLDSIIHSTNELVVLVNAKGNIEEISEAYAEFLSLKREDVIGKPVIKVIENTRLVNVLETGIPEVESTQKINGKNMIATRTPIKKDGQIIGAFGRVLFKDVDDLKKLYDKMNKMKTELNLYKSRFFKLNAAKYSMEDIIGSSDNIRQLKKTIKIVAKTNSNILILGESGTGKELFAHSLHSSSKRNNMPFICINCGSIPAELMESELFGYEEGAFTGAKKGGKIGLFQAANYGTIFLDEIGDLPMSMQVKILRFLQDREIQKVGASTREVVDVRIVAATNKNLEEMVIQGQFRSDLYYRLNVITLQVPALRNRKDDIPKLANFLVEKFTKKENMDTKIIADKTLEYLKRYDWPGNVRELENILERAVNFLGSDRLILPEHLPEILTGCPNNVTTKSLKKIIDEVEMNAIINSLLQNQNNKTNTANALGISRTSLYEKMKKYGIGEEV